MTSKNISIKKETYDKLRALKGESESFTEVIEQLIRDSKKIGNNLGRFFGTWKDDPVITPEMIRSNRAELNDQLRKRFS
ncbi:MAG: antitoxin VapB family protein [Promethearchaeota archaeon]